MTLIARQPDPRDALTPDQRKVLRLLARGHTPASAAALTRLSEERVRRWAAMTSFRDALDRERADPSAPPSSLGDELRAAARADEAVDVPTSQSARRSKATDLLAAGLTITEAAELAGYSRGHLSSLVNHDPDFQQELALRKAEAHQARANRFWSIWDKSAGAVERSIEEGDPRVAMEVFRLGSRGVTDITYQAVSADDGAVPALPPPLPEEEHGQGRRRDIRCEACGLAVKSMAGLKRHRRAKHAS
jgi:hypothetical protein